MGSGTALAAKLPSSDVYLNSNDWWATHVSSCAVQHCNLCLVMLCISACLAGSCPNPKPILHALSQPRQARP
jgi:hypothetical protein